MKFAGYAALFGTADAGRDTISPGAFARTLAERQEPLPLYWQHRPDQRIGWIGQLHPRLARNLDLQAEEAASCQPRQDSHPLHPKERTP